MQSRDEAVDVEAGETVPCLDAQTPALKGLEVLNGTKPCFSSSSSTSGILLKNTEAKGLLMRLPEPLMDASICHLLMDLPAVSSKHIHSLELLVNGSFTSSDVLQERRIPLIEHKHESKWPGEGEKPVYIRKKYHGLLITATILAAITFHATLRSPAIFSHNSADQMIHLFILLNSVAFFTSVAVITLLTCHLPIKPWLWIVLFSAVGAYICAVLVVSPNELGTVILAGNCVLIAALFKYWARDRSNGFTRNQFI